jgi:hypothetical protein
MPSKGVAAPDSKQLCRLSPGPSWRRTP